MASNQVKVQSRRSSDADSMAGRSKKALPTTLQFTEIGLDEPHAEDERGSGRVLPVPAMMADASLADVPSLSALPLRMMIIGSRQAVLKTIKILHHLRYAEATDWSKLQHGSNPGEVMSVLTVRASRLCL